jgi:prepilin-type N-terminal cleavage/methylation domain-containing protein
MPTPRIGAARRRESPGFSIVELLVALTLLALGLLGLAGTALSIARLQRDGATRSLAAAMAESRLELVRAARCVPTSGDTSTGALVEHWHVAPLGGNAQELIDSIAIPGASGRVPRTEIFRSAVQC